MKQLSLFLVLVAGLVAPTAQAVSPKPETIETLAKALGDAFTSKALARLDAKHPYQATVKMVIENSLADTKAPDRFKSNVFKSLSQADLWLKSREKEGLPSRAKTQLQRCQTGLCTYATGGLLHNHLYLQKMAYTQDKGRFYIQTIYLLDGN